MRTKQLIPWFVTLVFLAGLWHPAGQARAGASKPELMQASTVTAYDLIAAMNTLRVSYGLPALIEDPIIDAVAQATADIMAANQMSWHIGDVRGRIAAAGYGGGATVFATENFAAGYMSIDEIMVAWSDESHMRPAVNPAYCHVGAGVSTAANGMTYYVLQAAYISGSACGEYTSEPGVGVTPGSSAYFPSQIIMPVKISTPDASGEVYHIVAAGQSFWSIAIAYQITIRDIEIWNNLSRNTPLQTGQRLFIPGKNTKGYATPTPVGMIVPSAPDEDGRIVHVVQPYQALIPIAEAYDITVDTILGLNGWQEEWPLQVGQKLLIDPGDITPSPTPRPLTPVEKLTPAGDGNYYHIIQQGETLSWIAGLYEVPLADLLAWNNLTAASIIRPEQKLLLQVTPPATATFTHVPMTQTPFSATPRTPKPATTIPAATDTLPAPALSPTSLPLPKAPSGAFVGILALLGIVATGGLFVWVGIARSWIKISRFSSSEDDLHDQD
ncbi:MAG: LysM peptidoglycan-binding domain-containing protein [Chloroflexota bacterium]